LIIEDNTFACQSNVVMRFKPMVAQASETGRDKAGSGCCSVSMGGGTKKKKKKVAMAAGTWADGCG